MNAEWEADSGQASWHTQRNEHAWLTTWPPAHGLEMAWNTPAYDKKKNSHKSTMSTNKNVTSDGISFHPEGIILVKGEGVVWDQ